MSTKKLSPIEAFLALTDEEKQRQVREFDKEFVAGQFRPLTPEQRKMWDVAKKKSRGRPKVGNGAQVISLSVEKALLKRADARAKAAHMSRSQLVAMALEALLGKKKAG
jgi:hypothetical protein